MGNYYRHGIFSNNKLRIKTHTSTSSLSFISTIRAFNFYTTLTLAISFIDVFCRHQSWKVQNFFSLLCNQKHHTQLSCNQKIFPEQMKSRLCNIFLRIFFSFYFGFLFTFSLNICFIVVYYITFLHLWNLVWNEHLQIQIIKLLRKHLRVSLIFF